MKRVGLGVVVALACAAACNAFSADAPSTSNASNDAGSPDGSPPVVEGVTTLGPCGTPQVEYDWDTRTPVIGTDAILAGNATRLTDDPLHHGYLRLVGGGGDGTNLTFSSSRPGKGLCYSVSIRTSTPARTSGLTYTALTAGYALDPYRVGAIRFGLKGPFFIYLSDSSPEPERGPELEQEFGTWHVYAWLLEPTATGMTVLGAIDGTVQERRTLPKTTIAGYMLKIGDTDNARREAGSTIDVDDVRIRVDP